MTLLNKTKSINCSILEFSNAAVTKILLFGVNTLSDSCNTLILNSTIDCIISTKRLYDSHFNSWIINKKHYMAFLLAFLFSVFEMI